MNIFKEPLVVFLMIAILIFVADRVQSAEDGDRRIDMTEATRASILAQWEAQMGRPPTDDEMTGLVEQWVKEEIYYREAARLGLADNDVIIRRRLVQKLTFLTEDIATAVPPTDAELRAYYDDNLDRYVRPPTWSFSHRYFSSESRDTAEADARAALADPDGRDDPFMLQKYYDRQSRQQIGALFGTDFANRVVGLDTGTWQGPVLSAYGWHIVRVEAHEPARQQPFEEVTGMLSRDYLMEQRADANAAYYESLQARYEIVR